MVANNPKAKLLLTLTFIGLGIGLVFYVMNARTTDGIGGLAAQNSRPLTAPANIKDPNFRQIYYARGIAKAVNTCQSSCNNQCTKNGRGEDAKALCYQACDTYYKNESATSSKQAIRTIHIACAPLR